MATLNRHKHVVIELLKSNSIDENLKSKYDKTALHLATAKRHADVVVELLRSNEIRVYFKDDGDKTALDLASEMNSFNNIAILLEVCCVCQTHMIPPCPGLLTNRHPPPIGISIKVDQKNEA